MVAYLPSSSRPSKVAPRRHWTTMQGLLMHSRQLHQVLDAAEREDARYLRLHSPRPTASVPRAVAPQAKPTIVFRKTKREIQREREHERELAAKKSREEEQAARLCQASSGLIMQQLDSLRSTILASCKRLTSGPTSSYGPSHPQRCLSCRMQCVRRARTATMGLSRRCPPRRRLLF